MSSVYDEAAKLKPILRKYKKLGVAFVTATLPYVTYLVAAPHSAEEIVGWTGVYILGLFGVSEAKNGS